MGKWTQAGRIWKSRLEKSYIAMNRRLRLRLVRAQKKTRRPREVWNFLFLKQSCSDTQTGAGHSDEV